MAETGREGWTGRVGAQSTRCGSRVWGSGFRACVVFPGMQERMVRTCGEVRNVPQKLKLEDALQEQVAS